MASTFKSLCHLSPRDKNLPGAGLLPLPMGDQAHGLPAHFESPDNVLKYFLATICCLKLAHCMPSCCCPVYMALEPLGPGSGRIS